MRRMVLLCVCVLLAVGMSSPRDEQAMAQELTRPMLSGPAFPVFNATLYLNKPDLEQTHGFITLRTHGRLWPQGADISEPQQARVVAAISRIPRNDLFFVDIEHWPLNGDPDKVAQTIRKYQQVTRWIREARPDLRFGYYGVPPIRDYWRAIQAPDAKGHQAWLAENDALAVLTEDVDAVFPSLYTFYEDREGWVKYALANIKEARQYGKPVYPFLWMQYHDSHKERKREFIEPDFWRLQLETCLKHADGVVIWGGWKGPDGRRLSWDPTALWWRETISVMQRNGARLMDPDAPIVTLED